METLGVAAEFIGPEVTRYRPHAAVTVVIVVVVVVIIIVIITISSNEYNIHSNSFLEESS